MNPSAELSQAVVLERQAQELRSAKQIPQAFEAYDKAARLYKDQREHLKAAMCFAAAATCWDIHTGWQPLQNSSSRNHFAAVEAMKAGHFEYACSLFRNAAILYEKEGDWENYTLCMIKSQRAARARSWAIVKGRPSPGLDAITERIFLRDRLIHLFKALHNFWDDAVWGYSFRPFRALGLVASIIFCSAGIYFFGGDAMAHGEIRPLSFWESLYFSTITFSTVGFGDYTVLGWVRFFASAEALSGIIFMPLFLISLTQRYLRTFR